MKFVESIIAWDPDTGAMEVGRWPEPRGSETEHLPMTVGACEMRLHSMTPDQRLAMLFIHFHTIVVKHPEMDVQKVHQAFLKIDEYRAAIAPDIPGADNPGWL